MVEGSNSIASAVDHPLGCILFSLRLCSQNINRFAVGFSFFRLNIFLIIPFANMNVLSALFGRKSRTTNITSPSHHEGRTKHNSYDYTGRTVLGDRYMLNRMLMGGQASIVYEATKIETGEIFACKIIYLIRTRDEPKLHFFCSLDSNNVAKLHQYYNGTGEEWPYAFMIMDMYRGGDLYTRVSEKIHTPLTDKNIKEIFIQILVGVEDCHRNRVYHQDLKPENVLFKEKENNSEVAITDFGLANRNGIDRCSVLGDPCFAAPGTVILRL